MEKTLKRPYPTNYNLVIVQDFLQAHSKISLTEFIKLNANMVMIIKNVKCVELNTRIVSVVLNTQTLKMI